jgi:lactate racemase
VAAPSFAERAISELPAAIAARFEPRSVAGTGSFQQSCVAALRAPHASPPLADLARNAKRVVLIVSDASRDEPREAMLETLRPELPWERVTLVVAAGTHIASASVVPEPFRDRPVVVHDAHAEERMVDLGQTRAGTRVRVLGEIAEADLVVVTGRIRPHYFAGWSGGVKGVFPGCGFAADILQNHELKAHPSARLGSADGNLCRADMEEAALRVPGRLFALNVLADVEGTPVAAAAGDVIEAHRALLSRARELFRVRAPRSSVVVVADRPPVSSSLYQASKLLPPAGALLEDGGTVILVADCREGTGPLGRVNQGIYELGVRPQLPRRHRVLLLSELPRELALETYAEPVDDLERAVRAALHASGEDRAVVLFRAGECIAEAQA